MNTDCLAGSVSGEVGFQVSPIISEQLHWSNLNNLGGILIIEIRGGFLLDLSHPPGAHSRTTRNFVTVAPLPFSTSPTHMAAGPYTGSQTYPSWHQISLGCWLEFLETAGTIVVTLTKPLFRILLANSILLL